MLVLTATAAALMYETRTPTRAVVTWKSEISFPAAGQTQDTCAALQCTA